MTDFNTRWQTLADRARTTAPRESSMPFGFATRVVALASAAVPRPESLERVWQGYLWRCLGVVSVVMVLVAALEAPHFRDRQPLNPGIENAVGHLVWKL